MSGYYKSGRMPAWLLAMYAKQPKKYARNAVRVALDNGTLIRPSVCARGDRTCKGRIQAHHHSYAVDQWLNVEWLCASHHTRVHRHRKPAVRLELTTARLQIGCSTTELRRHANKTSNEVATSDVAA